MNGCDFLKLPRRPRTHTLDTEGIIAIKNVIPSDWTFQRVENDYGLDADIEIFDKVGYTTGLKFFLQLKSTDKPRINKNGEMLLRIKRTTLNYFCQLSSPILIVIYNSINKNLYCRWFHNYDAIDYPEDTETVSLKLIESDIWTNIKNEEIVEDVRAHNYFTSPALPMPLLFNVFVKKIPIKNVKKIEFLKELRKKVKQVNIIKFVEGVYTSNEIIIDAVSIQIYIAKMPGFRLYFPDGIEFSESVDEISGDIFVVLGIALSRHGHSTVGSKLIINYIDNSGLKNINDIVFQTGISLVQSGNYSHAMRIASKFLNNGGIEIVNTVQNLLLPMLSSQKHLSAFELEEVIEYYKVIIEKVVSLGDNIHGAIFNYNIGNMLKSNGQFSNAINYYRRAAELDEDYKYREYYWREMAGILFEKKKFKMSAKFYENALCLKENVNTKVLYADSQLFLGNYSKADQVFKEIDCFCETTEPNEWIIKKTCISWMIKHLNIKSQNRIIQPCCCDECRSSKKLPMLDETTEILNLDALCSSAWHYRGIYFYGKGELEIAQNCFLMQAISDPYDPNAWSNLLGIYLEKQLFDNIFIAILNRAILLHDIEVLLELCPELNQQAEFYKTIVELAESIQTNGNPSVIRAHFDIGWDEFKYIN